MVEKSLVSVAYEILSEDYNNGKKEPKPFLELCAEICSRINMTEEEFTKLVSRFYTDLTLDGRFIIKENNTWSLREHELYKNIHIDMNKAYSTLDEDESDEDKRKDDNDENDLGDDDSDFLNDEKEENNYEDDDTVESGMDDDNDEND